MDSSYIFEINVLGYPPPPPDNGNGGDDLYDVYLNNLASGTYGYTDFDFQIDGGTWTSYMVLDNKFDTHYTKGIEAASVTAAHELHHGIQIGNYLYRDSDNFYYELTSTSMEEFVFDDVNDYYGYMDSYFRYPHESLTKSDGYSTAIWNIYLQERFEKESPGLGYDIIKRSWELMPRNRAATAIAKAIQGSGYTLKGEFNNFGLWTFFTGDKSKPDEYFEEGQNYPSIRPLVSLEFIPPKTVWTINSEPISNNFLLFKDFSNGFSDTLVSIITNADITGSEKSSPSNLDFVYSLLSSTQEGAVKINDFYYSKIESSSDDLFSETNIFNNEPAKTDFVREEIEFAFPQPFRYSENEVLFFPVAPDPSGEAELRIYSAGMNQVYYGLKKIMAGEKIFVQWNGKDLNNNKLPTGVYIYITKSGDNDKKGKIIIYND